MPHHLPHDPRIWWVAFFTLYVLCVAVAVAIRIWHKPKKKVDPLKPGMYRAVVTAVELEKAANTLRINLTANANAFVHQIKLMAASAEPCWLDADPPRWSFPTWRVTTRPFDWRND
jgi:hypothetical protein